MMTHHFDSEIFCWLFKFKNYVLKNIITSLFSRGEKREGERKRKKVNNKMFLDEGSLDIQ